MPLNEIVILSAARTPLGAFQGALASLPAPRLGAAAVRGAVTQAAVSPTNITDLFMGNVLQAGLGHILVTLLAALRERGGKRGLAAICIGGGEGLAACLELL